MDTKEIQQVTLGIMIIGVTLIVAIFIFASMSDNFIETQSKSIINETLTSVTETGENLALSSLRDASCSITQCLNSSDGVLITSGNITATNCNIAFKIGATGTNFNNTDWKCSYSTSFTNNTQAGHTSLDLIDSLGTGTAWLSIIITVVFAIVILRFMTAGLNDVNQQTETAPTY